MMGVLFIYFFYYYFLLRTTSQKNSCARNDKRQNRVYFFLYILDLFFSFVTIPLVDSTCHMIRAHFRSVLTVKRSVPQKRKKSDSTHQSVRLFFRTFHRILSIIFHTPLTPSTCLPDTSTN